MCPPLLEPMYHKHKHCKTEALPREASWRQSPSRQNSDQEWKGFLIAAGLLGFDSSSFRSGCEIKKTNCSRVIWTVNQHLGECKVFSCHYFYTSHKNKQCSKHTLERKVAFFPAKSPRGLHNPIHQLYT
jgi:hypothetical protein